MATIQELARELSGALEHARRSSGEHEPGLDHYVRRKDGSPQWVADVCRAAHGALLPDDWRYEFIKDAAGALAENGGDLDAAQEALNDGDHYVYTSQLTGWLHSSNSRFAYVDEDSELYNPDANMTTRLACGIGAEQRETLGLVYRALEEIVDDAEEEEEDDPPTP